MQIMSQKADKQKRGNLLFKDAYPDKIKFWMSKLNAPLLIEDISAGSSKKVWWGCEQGHTFQKEAYAFAKHPCCPKCKSLECRFPEIAKLWDVSLNGGRKPSEVSPSSAKKAWWRCADRGHLIQKQICRVTETGGINCSKCRSLQYTYPGVAQFWHPELNGDLSAEDTGPGSREEAYWKCDQGHCYKNVIRIEVERFKRDGCRCLECLKLEKYDLLSEAAPDIVDKYWSKNLNKNILPKNFSVLSQKKVWWECDKGHSWKKTINAQVKNPDCFKCKKSLASRFPEIAKLWAADLNKGLSPENIGGKSGKNFWWRCPKGHKWQSSVVAMTEGKGVCKNCQMESRSLEVCSPAASSFWGKRNSLRPSQVLAQANTQEFFWECRKGHKWKDTPRAMLISPYCSRCKPGGIGGGFKKTLPGFLYAILSNDEKMVKIGISNCPQKRISHHRKQGFEKIIYLSYYSNGKDARKSETEFFKRVRAEGVKPTTQISHLPYAGVTETFDVKDFKNIRSLVAVLKRFSINGTEVDFNQKALIGYDKIFDSIKNS